MAARIGHPDRETVYRTCIWFWQNSVVQCAGYSARGAPNKAVGQGDERRLVLSCAETCLGGGGVPALRSPALVEAAIAYAYAGMRL